MSLEERIQQSVETALAAIRARVEDDVRSMVKELVSAAEQERAAAEERVRADLERVLDEARAKEREAAQEDAWRLAEAKAEQRIEEAVSVSRQEMQLALTTAEERAEEAMRHSVAAAHVGEREAEMAAISRLLDSIRGLDGASSLSEVLDALGLAAGREASRAAVFVLRADRLHGWKLSGFGARDAQPKTIEMTLAEAGVLGHAVGVARPVTTRDAQTGAEGPWFAQLPEDRMGLAVPVIVGGRVVAVVYADSVAEDRPEQLVPSTWPEVIEILARHAARCLEALTVQKSATTTPSPRFWVPPGGKGAGGESAQQSSSEAQAFKGGEDPPAASPNGARMSGVRDMAPPMGAEHAARRFARLLLTEIGLLPRDEGRRSRNLLSRLALHIVRARQLYEAQVPASLCSRAELVHHELVATPRRGDAAVLNMPA